MGIVTRPLESGRISEHSIKDALKHARGDLMVSAGILRLSLRALDQFIRRSPELQTYVAQVAEIKVSADYDKLSNEQFEAELTSLAMHHKIEATNVIYNLATMDFGDSAAMAKITLDAALALRGGAITKKVEVEENTTMSELNALYHANALRIREIRTTVTTFQDERLIN